MNHLLDEQETEAILDDCMDHIDAMLEGLRNKLEVIVLDAIEHSTTRQRDNDDHYYTGDDDGSSELYRPFYRS